MINGVMYVPTASGGHARYATELLTALRSLPVADLRMGLVTSSNLAEEYRSTDYPIHSVLEPLFIGQFPTVAHKMTSRVGHYWRRERAFLRWLRHRPDVRLVHFQEYFAPLAPLHFALLRRTGRRLFYTVHNIHPHRRSVGSEAVSRMWRAAWRLCNGLFVHSPALKAELEAFLGKGHPPVHVTPHGVWSRNRRDVEPDETKALRRQLLCFGTIRRNKGFHVLLDALASLPGYRLCIAGAPEDATYARQLAARAATMSERVECILEFIATERTASLFENASAVVLPYTHFAAQSGVLHDALAFETPVVVSNVGALGESVAEMGIGEIVEPNCPVALADAVKRLHMPERYERTLEALRTERDRLSWSATARRTYSAYAEESRDRA